MSMEGCTPDPHSAAPGTAEEAAPICPLCQDRGATAYHRDRWRSYWRCRVCALVYVSPSSHPTPQAEKARYDQHQNDPGDNRYRQFLSQLSIPLLDRVAPGAVGLDFGSGPGPTLGPMLTEAGLSVQLYDPFYAPNAAVWKQRYDFITASEVVEHLHAPRKELARLFSALKPGGYLGILTQWIIDDNVFIRSRYIRDPTHVCFFSAFTCTWIARHWAVSLELPGRGVSLFRTPP